MGRLNKPADRMEDMEMTREYYCIFFDGVLLFGGIVKRYQHIEKFCISRMEMRTEGYGYDKMASVW